MQPASYGCTRAWYNTEYKAQTLPLITKSLAQHELVHQLLEKNLWCGVQTICSKALHIGKESLSLRVRWTVVAAASDSRHIGKEPLPGKA